MSCSCLTLFHNMHCILCRGQRCYRQNFVLKRRTFGEKMLLIEALGILLIFLLFPEVFFETAKKRHVNKPCCCLRLFMILKVITVRWHGGIYSSYRWSGCLVLPFVCGGSSFGLLIIQPQNAFRYKIYPVAWYLTATFTGSKKISWPAKAIKPIFQLVLLYQIVIG